ncbi:hypothetical protein N7491_007673 [Penicillium cf. griseofulvum]|uniref:Fucose-specific lectin n=1 Tax=Penicillium cf. griseofulvum TaxID=2972120 RepID=A0A9W9M1T9_9EURO|nr:hypothetical protein N7472_009302 [Penicillium cf. griseofulvum]KAJ5430657.1 hypothetical protein N7491_007673 [Penicillium cf. griseofulvum]KAJ5435575.1 hypothetical protein N7445_006460 [Penicillium cf. griseofulvum]
MDFDLQGLANALSAKAYAFPHNETGVHLVDQSDNELYEEHRAGSHNLNQWLISFDARESTPVAYLWDKNIRYLYCLDQDNALQHYQYSQTDQDWISIRLSGDNKPVVVHGNTRLSGCIASPDSQIVFFQDPSGQLRGARVQSGRAEPLSTPISEPSKLGTPHFAVLREDLLRLWYLAADNQVHCLTQARGSDDGWRDHPVPGAAFGSDKIDNFTIGIDENGSVQIIVLSSEGKVIRVDHQGQRTALGTIVDGMFRPASSAENLAQFVADVCRAAGKVLKK